MSDEIIVITGSSKQFSKEISELASAMKDKGKTVIIDSLFHFLSEPRGRKQFMRSILDSDKLLVYNKNNYIGFHTQFEIILAQIAGIPVEYQFKGENITLERLEELYYKWKNMREVIE